MNEEIKKWWKRAKGDLKKAKDNLNIKNYDLTSFLCQQAVEKALKALLIKKTKKFPKIHDLVRLGRLVDIDKDLLKNCEKLTSVYVETRYPDISDIKYTKEEAEQDIKTAKKVIKWVREKISLKS